MKFTVLALGAAVAGISCVTPCSAQLNIEPTTGHQPSSRLAYQNSESDRDVFGQAYDAADDEAPFGFSSQGPDAPAPATQSDYFAQGAPAQGVPPQGAARQGIAGPQTVLTEQPSKFTSVVPSITQGLAPAQAPLGVLASTPEAGMVPIYWPEDGRGCRTPNPIADIMMHNWCTDGLWDSYAAQRACKCARIQHHTGGYNRYTQGCGSCAPNYAWSAPSATDCAGGGPMPPLASAAQPAQGQAAQLVISPVMSAPAQLPAAQAAASPSVRACTVVEPPPTQPPARVLDQYPATHHPLPEVPWPAEVPVVANRPAGLVR